MHAQQAFCHSSQLEAGINTAYILSSAAACLQVTAFVALLALDARRISQRRCDAAPCVRLPASLMYGQEGQDVHDGQIGASGQNGQLSEPLVEGSSGEMPLSTQPLSTQPMHRESSGASPAGGSTHFLEFELFSIYMSGCGYQMVPRHPVWPCLKPLQQHTKLHIPCALTAASKACSLMSGSDRMQVVRRRTEPGPRKHTCMALYSIQRVLEFEF